MLFIFTGILQFSRFGQSIIKHTLNLSSDCTLPGDAEKVCPHYFVGDAAFPLKRNMMRPYPGRSLDNTKCIFNYQLSRTIENAFGILTARWRILLTTMEYAPENAEKIVLACIALHNFITHNEAYFVFHEGGWK